MTADPWAVLLWVAVNELPLYLLWATIIIIGLAWLGATICDGIDGI